MLKKINQIQPINDHYKGELIMLPEPITQEKIDAVKQYLQAEFPGFQVTKREIEVYLQFTVLKDSTTFYKLQPTVYFWKCVENVKKKLEEWEISKVMKNNLKRTVFVDEKGKIQCFDY